MDHPTAGLSVLLLVSGAPLGFALAIAVDRAWQRLHLHRQQARIQREHRRTPGQLVVPAWGRSCVHVVVHSDIDPVRGGSTVLCCMGQLELGERPIDLEVL